MTARGQSQLFAVIYQDTKNMNKLVAISISTIAATLLLSCSAERVNTSEFPVESVITKMYDSDNENTVYAGYETKDGDVLLALQSINTKGADTSFDGKAASSSAYQVITSLDDVELDKSEGVTYFQASPFKYLGSVTDDGEYEKATSHGIIPKTAKIGESGEVTKSTTYTDSTEKNQVSDSLSEWSLKSASDDTAWLCESVKYSFVNQDENDRSGSFCTEIDVKGNIIRHKTDMDLPDGDTTKNVVFISQ